MSTHSVEAAFNVADNLSPNILTMITSLDGLATAAAGVAIAIGMTAFDSMETMNKAMAGVAARTGASGDALNLMRVAAENLFNTGLVKNFDDAARAAEAAHEKIKGLSDPALLGQFLTDAAGVAKAWGVSTEDVITDVQNIQNKFGDLKGKPIEALDLLTTVAQKSHLPMDKLNTIIMQIGSKLSAAGLSATDMGGLIVMGVNAGITKWPALANAIDTFTNNIAKPSPAFLAGMKTLGLGDVVTELQQNKIPMSQALDLVFGALGKLPTPAAETAVATKLFGKNVDALGGGPGMAALKGFPSILADTANKAHDVAVAMADDGTLGSAITRLGNRFKTELGADLQAFFTAAKSDDWSGVAQLFQDTTDQIIGIWSNVFGIPGGILYTLSVNILGAIIAAAIDAQPAASKAFAGIASVVVAALEPIINIINNIIMGIDAIADSPVGAALHMPHIALIGHAGGGSVADGLFIVGEQGPELGMKSGSNVQIFSNSQSKQMVGSKQAQGAGGGTTNQFNGTYNLYGAGGVAEFARIVTKAQQQESNRRGTRQ